MCDICLQYPCNPRCPNALAPRFAYTCKYCKQAVEAGEAYVEVDGDFYHEECFDECATEILLKEYGAVKGIMEAG